MSEEIPWLILGQEDLEAIGAMLTKYLAYLRREPAATKLERHKASVEQLRRKIDGLRTAPIGNQAFLTLEDLEVLTETLQHYATLLRRVAPPSRERTSILEGIRRLRQDIHQRLT